MPRAAQPLPRLSDNACGLFSPLEGPESLRTGNPRKMGNNYKIPLPGPTPENGENWPQKEEKLLRKCKICNFSVIFPHFRGSARGGEFCNFSPFFGDLRPGGSPGPVRGKTTRCKTMPARRFPREPWRLRLCDFALTLQSFQEWPRQTKPKKVSS